MHNTERSERGAVCEKCRAVYEPNDQFCVGCGAARPGTSPNGFRVPGTMAGTDGVRPPAPRPQGQAAAEAQVGAVRSGGVGQHLASSRPLIDFSPRPAPAAPPVHPPEAVRDEVTRYLCAAVHMEDALAAKAIAEYLVEDTRTVPPLPGFDVAAVVREAVAARQRQRIRDGLLLGLVVLLLLTALPLVVLWVLSAALVMIVGARFGPGLRLVAAIMSAGVGALSLLAALGLGQVLGAVGFPGLGALSVLVVLLVLSVLGVLAVDEHWVDRIVRGHCREGVFVPNAADMPANDPVRAWRTLGHARYRRQLVRLAAAAASVARPRFNTADVVVHRHWKPFVGAGEMVRDEVMALPLEPDDDHSANGHAGSPTTFRPSELHDHVTAEMARLRDSASLSPGGRLAELSVLEQVFVPAEQLVRGRGTTLRHRLLPDLRRPPLPTLPLPEARRLADEPEESARYYRCYRIEAWDRDLSTSTYLTLGTDSRTLYIEWTHCVLLPIDDRYRAADRPAETDPFRRAFEAAVVLPMTLPQRVVTLFRRFSPLPFEHDRVAPDRYGAGESVRESAATVRADVFFQDADAVRYLQLVEQTMFRAIASFLADRGWSPEDVLGTAKSKINYNNMVIHGGTFNDSAVSATGAQRSGAPSARTGRKEQA